MRTATRTARSLMPHAPTAICVVRFGHVEERAPESKPPNATGRVPRVARLLALAHRIEGMILAGELKDWADAARLGGVTRARMTQIANLLLLAPHIQESLLTRSPVVAGGEPVSERALRSVVSEARWAHQDRHWHPLF